MSLKAFVQNESSASFLLCHNWGDAEYYHMPGGKKSTYIQTGPLLPLRLCAFVNLSVSSFSFTGGFFFLL